MQQIVYLTLAFAGEMLLKLFGEGLASYVSDDFNKFDGAVVVISVLDLVANQLQIDIGLNANVLRAFRLLRVFKLVRSWKNLRIVLQATEALLHLHGLGCVHRDFKPANILLQADLHAMLSDTGFAKAASVSEGTKRASMTARGAVHTTG